MFALAWQYLTGRAVATDVADRQKAEWPPHPDRVLQALVAAWGAAGGDAVVADALRWLMAAGEPEIAVPFDVVRPEPVKTYVPVNDVAKAGSGYDYREDPAGLLPSNRPRKERYFPAVIVGETCCALSWSAAPSPDHAAALKTLAEQVTHIGHSSSLVRMWVTDAPPPPTLRPAVGWGEFQLRVAYAGRLEELVARFAEGGPEWQRPPLARWQSYERIAAPAAEPTGEFDRRLLILRRTNGSPLTLTSAPALVAALRGLLIAAADSSPVAKRLISGHEADGAMLRDPHLAVLPLGFVTPVRALQSRSFGDGRMMGLALALPLGLPSDDEQAVLHTIAAAFRLEGTRERTLHLGTAGALTVALDSMDVPPLTLRPEAWVAPSSEWASVTPIALDRSPPRRHAELDQWAATQIAEACIRQGLGEPEEIALSGVPAWRGAPACREFPALFRKDGTRRWHTHARLRFRIPVAGPVVLGAGRYRGYGLFRPLSEGREQ